jgi:hypothetical protein
LPISVPAPQEAPNVSDEDTKSRPAPLVGNICSPDHARRSCEPKWMSEAPQFADAPATVVWFAHRPPAGDDWTSIACGEAELDDARMSPVLPGIVPLMRPGGPLALVLGTGELVKVMVLSFQTMMSPMS